MIHKKMIYDYEIKADEYIVFYAINKQQASIDALVVLPMAALGQEFYVIAWSYRSAFMIIRTESDTEVDTKLGQRSPSVIMEGVK